MLVTNGMKMIVNMDVACVVGDEAYEAQYA
jgi:hypothetical protein